MAKNIIITETAIAKVGGKVALREGNTIRSGGTLTSTILKVIRKANAIILI